VTFNDHEDSTKSYAFTRQFYHPAVHTDFVPPAEEIRVGYEQGDAMEVELHDGSHLALRRVEADYDPTNRNGAFVRIHERMQAGEWLTGLLYVETGRQDMHGLNKSVAAPLATLPFNDLCPGAATLERTLARYR
jgi:2-oxoglutarate ferredoxin oxidoreductase subunit beta